MSSILRTFVSLHGAAGRRDWWLVTLAAATVIAFLWLAGMVQGGAYSLMVAMVDNPVVAGLVGVVCWAPVVPVSIRRLRDRRMSPWWLAVVIAWSLVAPAVIGIADRASALILGNSLQLAGVVLTLFLFVQMALLPSRLTDAEPAA